LQLKNSLL